MFKLKTNEEIGIYLKEIILTKYKSQRQFCIMYLKLQNGQVDLDNENIRKMTNRVSQILKGIKGIQTYDLPIFSQLLELSCEQILTAGEICKPISNRKTNYNIAFSNYRCDWEEYINREDCIAAYADEFGKTVVDYAIEFKNYGLIKFLIENEYINFASNNKGSFEYWANTTIKERPYEHKTLEDEMYENKLLRTQIISLALENNDYTVLDEMRAREIPSLMQISYFNLDVDFNAYYDAEFLDAILNSNKNVITYFCEEYSIETINNIENKWLFPFINKLIEKAVSTKNRYTNELLDVSIKRNEEALQKLKKNIFKVAKEIKNEYGKNMAFIDIIEKHVLNDYRISTDKTIISFNAYYRFIEDIERFITNIIYVNVISEDSNIQSKIDKLNDLHTKIINLKDHLFNN